MSKFSLFSELFDKSLIWYVNYNFLTFPPRRTISPKSSSPMHCWGLQYIVLFDLGAAASGAPPKMPRFPKADKFCCGAFCVGGCAGGIPPPSRSIIPPPIGFEFICVGAGEALAGPPMSNRESRPPDKRSTPPIGAAAAGACVGG